MVMTFLYVSGCLLEVKIRKLIGGAFQSRAVLKRPPIKDENTYANS